MGKFDALEHEVTLYLDCDSLRISSSVIQLLQQELDEFETVLGCKVRLGTPLPGSPRWIIAPSTEPRRAPSLRWDSSNRQLISSAANETQFLETLNLLHTLASSQANEVSFSQPLTPFEAAQKIHDEILGSFPSFSLRGISPKKWVDGRLQKVPQTWNEFAHWAQSWVAELGDAHTSVINTKQIGYNPPYIGEVLSNGIRLTEVPNFSQAYHAGVREGWVVHLDNPKQWLATTGAVERQHSKVAARRAMSMPHNRRRFLATAPNSSFQVSWDETRQQPSLKDVIQVSQDGHEVYIRLRHFDPKVEVETVFDELCKRSSKKSHLTLDLRGNPGGSLTLAHSLQRRFLRRKTLLGSIVFTDGNGNLGKRYQRYSSPFDGALWKGELVIIIDELTYSAAEDFVLGLQGLNHVRITGSPSGGGSGRPRLLPLGPDLLLRVSTAITYDREGNPVEFRGLVPD